ncbi:Regulatory protein SoxS [Planctomycetes bacterium Pan216]|uniref:Regulatory protein SoxS n=1 Tax=Kolteria novifilia TaxID=2527975 RepID=A0A518BBV1_9BACT|nr:Regulatory protein SoxS [Planctomycetes bacterium Pan216]
MGSTNRWEMIKPALELRSHIEELAAREAARRVGAGADVKPLLGCFDQLRAATERGSRKRFVETDRRLHELIARIANVPGLLEAWRCAFAAVNAFRVDTIDRCWPDLSALLDAHRGLVETISKGDEVGAAQAGATHCDSVWYRLHYSNEIHDVGDDALARTMAYVAFHLNERLRLTSLARRVAGCSPGHLARRFRDEQGLSFTDYVMELRLQRAAELLRETADPIRMIAAHVGYQDPSRFSAHFRRRFGRAPRNFRAGVALGHS